MDGQENSHKRRWSEWATHLEGVVGLGIGAIGVYFVPEARFAFGAAAHSYGFRFLLCTVIVASICWTGYLFKRTLRLRKAEQEVERLNVENEQLTESCKNLTEKRDEDLALRKGEATRRWDTFRRIDYGHIEFEPFVKYSGGGAVGPGIDLLTELLTYPSNGTTVKIHPYDDEGEWSNIFKLLKEERKYDVIATPMFATYERSREMRFTSPLFFSNIGLYVSESASILPSWKDLTAGKLQDAIMRAGEDEATISPQPFHFLCVQDEISQTLARKYVKDEKLIEVRGNKATPLSLFDGVARSTNPYKALFCGSFYAHDKELVRSGKVVNVLPFYQILYPVCFAVRFGDYHLTNLLNIRLLELSRQSEGILNKFAKMYANNNIDVEQEVKRHFVAEWPIKRKAEPVKEDAHA